MIKTIQQVSILLFLTLGLSACTWSIPQEIQFWNQDPTPPIEIMPTLAPSPSSSPDGSDGWRPVVPEPISPSPASDLPTDPAAIQAEIRQIRQQVISLLTRVEALEAQLNRQTNTNAVPNVVPTVQATPGIQPSLSPEFAPTPLSSPVVDPSPAPTPVADPSPTTAPSPTAEPTPLHVGTQTISLPGDVLFDFDRSEIRPEAAALLKRVANSLSRMPSGRILVAGHTDNVGDKTYNIGLSLDRANAVRDHLSKQIPKGKFSWTSSGYGSDQPVADNSTDLGRQQNRRVDLVIAP